MNTLQKIFDMAGHELFMNGTKLAKGTARIFLISIFLQLAYTKREGFIKHIGL